MLREIFNDLKLWVSEWREARKINARKWWRIVSPTASVPCGKVRLQTAIATAKAIGPIAFIDHDECVIFVNVPREHSQITEAQQ